MKKILFVAAISAVLLSACGSPSGSPSSQPLGFNDPKALESELVTVFNAMAAGKNLPVSGTKVVCIKSAEHTFHCLTTWPGTPERVASRKLG
jgi:hypothetical protein